MKTPWRRLLLLCLTVILLLGTLSGAVLAEEPVNDKLRKNNPEGYVYKNGMVWIGYTENTFDTSFNGLTQPVEKLSTYAVKYQGVYVPCFCIAPIIPPETDYPYTPNEFTTQDAWDSLTMDQRRAIGLALLYGYPNQFGYTDYYDKKGAHAATQLIVWEICYGMRSAVPPFECTDSRYIDLFFEDSKGNEFTDAGNGANNGRVKTLKSSYQQISDALAGHYVFPSFAARDCAFSPTYEMASNGDGSFPVTLTDTNGVLDQCTFTDTEDLSFSKNGNQLTITANKGISEMTVTAAKNVPNIDRQSFIVWTYANKQSMAQALAPTNDPTPLYFKLKVGLGQAQIVKETTNGGNVAGWHFEVKGSSGNLVGNYTTDSSGVITLDLNPGTYTVTETDGAYDYWVNDPNPTKTVTVAAGQTATVTFTNQWIGKAKIVKTLLNPEAGSLAGWTFTLHKLTDGGVEYLTTLTTGADGTIITDLEPGRYRITEILDSPSLWQCTTGLTQDITVTAGQTAETAFSNALRPGELRIQKVNTQDQPLAGVEFLLEWSKDGSAWAPVSYTDSAVPQIGGCTASGLANGKLLSNDAGAVTFSGLYPTLRYRLTETAALDGYQLLSGTAWEGELKLDQGLTVSLRVVNSESFTLPATGSRGFAWMPILALAWLGFGLCLRKRVV